MSSYDVVLVGNATVDNFLWIQDENKHFRMDEATRELCIKMGDKSLIEKAYFLVGGNAANVSVGLSRLGFKTAVVAEIGEDEFAQKIINSLSAEGVSDEFLRKNPNTSTSFSVIINYKGDRVILEEKVEKEHKYFFEGTETKWIYLTSVGDNWIDAYEKVIDFVKQKGVNLAFNPGVAQLDAGGEIIQDVLRNCSILFVNKEEAEIISGIKNVDNIDYETYLRKLLIELKTKCPGVVVITDGAKGSSMIDKNDEVHFHKPSDVASLERTCAGDSFASGFLGAVLSEKDYKTAMEWGTLNSASVITEVGSQSGLLRKDEIEQKSEHKND